MSGVVSLGEFVAGVSGIAEGVISGQPSGSDWADFVQLGAQLAGLFVKEGNPITPWLGLASGLAAVALPCDSKQAANTVPIPCAGVRSGA